MYKIYFPFTKEYDNYECADLDVMKMIWSMYNTDFGLNVWLVDMETGEILYQSDENESKKNNFCARVNAIAEELEQLSIDLAKTKANLKDPEDVNDVQEISDELFSWQSTLRYNVHAILECIFED